MRFFAVTLALVAVLAAGCSVLNASVPAPLSAYPAPAGVPTTEQTNVSPFPISQRIGRWNGTTFTAVTPGSLSGGNVIVMTHGWAAA